MVQRDTSGRGKDDLVEEDHQQSQAAAKGKNKRKARQRKRKVELKSKTTGVGLNISVEKNSTSAKNKIVFDDSNLPSDENDGDDKRDNEMLESEIAIGGEEDDDDDDDDDAVEEVQGNAARDEVMDQMKTEEKQSLKTKKKRKRKARKEKPKEDKTMESDDDGEEMDDDFFDELDSVRKVELEERKELEKSAARTALKGRHTTFVFAKNEDDDDGASDPVKINESIQVVVLKNPSSVSDAIANSSVVPNTSISDKALLYSRNRLKDGVDPAAGAAEMKRKRNRSGEIIQPWKRARKKLSMGRSRLTKGRPATFFKTKKR